MTDVRKSGESILYQHNLVKKREMQKKLTQGHV